MTASAEADALIHDDVAILASYAETRDPSVLSDLVERHQSLVQATCWQILGNRGLADDAAQETFILFLRHAGEVHSSVPGWLHRTATTTALQIRRRETARWRRESATHAMDQPCHPGDEVAVEVHELLGSLDPDDRDLIIRHYLMGQNQQVLAELLGVSQSAISRRIEAALERLRERQRGNSPARRLACLTLLLGFRSEIAAALDAQASHHASLHIAKTALWVAVGAAVCLGAGAWWWMAARSATGPELAQARVVASTPGLPQSAPAMPVATKPAQPPPIPADNPLSIASVLRWEHIAVQIDGGQAAIVQTDVLPSTMLLEAGRTWPLRKSQDSLIRSILVSDLPQVPLNFDLSLFYTSAGAPGFCDPIQRNPSLMPKGAWSVERQPFFSNFAAGPYPGSWHALHAEVTFQTDAGGQPITEIRRWCDGVEYGSTRHPGHPVQIILVQLDRGTGEIRDLRASRLTPTERF